MFDYVKYKQAKGNILKVQLGSRIIYLHPESIFDDQQRIVGYQVLKNGDIRYSKWSSKYLYDITYEQVCDILNVSCETD